jgi:hypothetical protein
VDSLFLRTNHGGICLFYVSSISTCEVPIPVYTSGIEVLAVLLLGTRRNFLVVILYWPETANNAFFNDLNDMLEQTSTFRCPVIIMGDINICLDVISDPHSVRFQTMLDSFGVFQNVSSATREGGYLLDVSVTRSDCLAKVHDVEQPNLSDHSFIITDIDLQFNHGTSASTIRRCQWRRFDYDKFCDDLKASTLSTAPPSHAAGPFACYDETLRIMVDKLAAFADVRIRAHCNAPWYDDDCRMVKTVTRRLERIYRQKKSEVERTPGVISPDIKFFLL